MSDPDQTHSFLETEWVRAVGTRLGWEVPYERVCARQTVGAAGVPSGSTATCQLLPLNGGLVWLLEAGTPGLSMEQLTSRLLLPLLPGAGRGVGGFRGKSSQCGAREGAKAAPCCLGMCLPCTPGMAGLFRGQLLTCLETDFSRDEGPGRQLGAEKPPISWRKVPEQRGDRQADA